MTETRATDEQEILSQLSDVRRELAIARQERDAIRHELKAMKRYVSILVQADLERDRHDQSVLVLRNPVNAENLISYDATETADQTMKVHSKS